jgi:alpha-galactosidase
MSILYQQDSQTIMLQGRQSTYAMQILEAGVVVNSYWGARVESAADLPTIKEICARDSIGRSVNPEELQEYAAWGGYTFNQPALKAVFADGTRDLLLRYCAHEIKGDSLTVTLRDIYFPLEVRVQYRIYGELDLIERCASITNTGTEAILLENMFSATWHLPYRDHYRLTWLSGNWAHEYQINRQIIQAGQTVLQTKTGLSGPDAAPLFMIDEDGLATEQQGDVYYGTLLWSGNWKMIIESNKYRQITVTGGINDFDTTWNLGPGETFITPIFTSGFTAGGFGAASRVLHRYERQVIMKPVEARRIMPVIYNAYGTFFAAINEEKIMGVIDTAHNLGIECLIIDAGWAGQGENYAQGMGVWDVNPERFPSGLKPIADKLHAYGMLFGLWMEPECVHVDSELVRAHPDWVLGYPSRDPSRHGVRLVLNYALDAVRDYMTAKTLDLIRRYDIDYFKIDFNRLIAQAGWPQAKQVDKPSVWIRYVRNLQQYYNTVKAEFPDILFENCAGGGMRVDLDMLRFSGRINRSDNQDPLDILKIHEGFSYFMLPKLAGGGCHISDTYTRYFNNRISSMKYQADIAMMGSLSIGKNLQTITQAEQDELKKYLALYKEIRPIVHLGEIYRLASAREKPYAAFEYRSEDGSKALLFILGQSMQFSEMPERLRLQGLDEQAEYTVEGFGSRTGRSLMKIGLPIVLKGDMDSQVIRISRMS